MKKYKPTSPSRRNMVTIDYRTTLTASKPHKPLTSGGKRSVGRNNQGRITTQHKGGGNKRLYRQIDFLYNKHNIPAKIETVEYDPNRSAFISPKADPHAKPHARAPSPRKFFLFLVFLARYSIF